MKDSFYHSRTYQILYREKIEIDKLKWIESEKEGRDIGKMRAVFLWRKYHRQQWLKEISDSI